MAQTRGLPLASVSRDLERPPLTGDAAQAGVLDGIGLGPGLEDEQIPVLPDTNVLEALTDAEEVPSSE